MIQQSVLPFKLEITKDEITPRSGLAVYAEFLRALGIDRLIEKYMPLPSSNRGKRPWQFIEPLMLMIYGGGRHIEDLREIKDDKALRKVIGAQDIPSTSTFGDWLKRMGRGKGLYGVKKVDEKIVKDIVKRHEGNDYTLWVDAFTIEAEKEEARMTYKGFPGYHPLIGALKEVPVILKEEFREGNEHPGARAVEFLEGSLKAMPSGKGIRHLGSDSALYQAEVINRCRSKGITFTITADQDSAVKEAIKGIPDREWRPLKDRDGIKTDREVAETVHSMEKTEEAFRLIVIRWINPQRNLFFREDYCYHCIATDLEVSPQEIVWTHNERGQIENYIKELKGGFGMEQMPSGEFLANAVYFALGVLVYNTTAAQKLFLLPKEWAKKTIHTIRWALIQVAGKVVRHGRRLTLKLATTYEKYKLYLYMREQCMTFI